MVIADYSQQEARIIAGLSKDERAIEIFKAGKDIYEGIGMASLFIGSKKNGQAAVLTHNIISPSTSRCP